MSQYKVRKKDDYTGKIEIIEMDMMDILKDPSLLHSEDVIKVHGIILLELVEFINARFPMTTRPLS